jgi:hypothetical protein
MTHTTSETGAQREHKRKRPSLPPTQGRMLRRLNELRRLAAFRTEHDVPLGDPDAWAMVIAEVCLYHRDGCDLLTFREVEGNYPIGISDDEAMAAIHSVCRIAKWRGPAYRPMRAATVGKLLDVTAEERWACDIRTVRAVDETPADAEVWRKEQDRERKREGGRKRRAAQGARPHVQSWSRTRPWEKRGICRRTMERHARVAKTSTPAHVAKTSVRHLLRHGLWTDEFATPPVLPAARASSARNGNGKRNGEHGARQERRLPTKQGTSAHPLGTVTPRPSQVVHLEAVGIG